MEDFCDPSSSTTHSTTHAPPASKPTAAVAATHMEGPATGPTAPETPRFGDRVVSAEGGADLPPAGEGAGRMQKKHLKSPVWVIWWSVIGMMALLHYSGAPNTTP